MAQIICKNLTLGYEGHAVLEQLNFSVEQGDYLCIVGANGSGKSTLMRTLLHLLSPMKGEVVLSDGLTRQDIGYLPQRTEVQKDFPASVQEVVLSGFAGKMGFLPYYRASQKEQAAQILARLGIADLAKRSFRTLSGGQQQRVLLARSLCAAGKMLLLDEPVSGLDPEATAEMYEMIRGLNEADGITVIMISHDVKTAQKDAHKILDVGRTPPFFGTAEDYASLCAKEEGTV